MEFKIRVDSDGNVWFEKYDPNTDAMVGGWMIWRAEWRQFKATTSALDVANKWAKTFSEFTGFEIVAES